MKTHKTKIELTDSTFDALYKLSEGNPGGLTVLVETMKVNTQIDPDCAFAEIGPMLSLDSYGIYGSDIWVLYKNCCGQNIKNFLAVLRALQLGLKDISEVEKAIQTCTPLDVDAIMESVQKRLPKFNSTQAAA